MLELAALRGGGGFALSRTIKASRTSSHFLLRKSAESSYAPSDPTSTYDNVFYFPIARHLPSRPSSSLESRADQWRLAMGNFGR